MKDIHDAIIFGIRDYFSKNNFKNGIIGLSGGIDSSVAASLAVKALGSENVTAILMPDSNVTSKENISDAKVLASKLKIRKYVFPIDDFIINFKKMKLGDSRNKEYALSNAKSRARMSILYYFANIDGSLVIGTSDKSEIALGYTTKYGDSAADILVIGDLWKTEVIKLGKFLEVSPKILKLYIEHGLSPAEIAGKGFDKRIVNDIVKRIRLNEHKRRNAILIKVSERSFHGMEWRMPITNRFKG